MLTFLNDHLPQSVLTKTEYYHKSTKNNPLHIVNNRQILLEVQHHFLFCSHVTFESKSEITQKKGEINKKKKVKMEKRNCKILGVSSMDWGWQKAVRSNRSAKLGPWFVLDSYRFISMKLLLQFLRLLFHILSSLLSRQLKNMRNFQQNCLEIHGSCWLNISQQQQANRCHENRKSITMYVCLPAYDFARSHK